jgi:hypothetical protein
MAVPQYGDYQYGIYFDDGLDGRLPKYPVDFASPGGCRLSCGVTNGDSSTCGFAEFSSKWRKRFSHLRGGS